MPTVKLNITADEYLASLQPPVRQSHFSGQQHAQVFDEYLNDDEPTFDLDACLDAAAYTEWLLADNEYDDYLQFASHPGEPHPALVY